MAYCKKCGAQIEENATYCPACGANQSESFSGMTFNDPGINKSSGSINVAQLIWAIINLVMCCTPLGIASIIMVVLAKDAPSAQDEAKKLQTAKICNLVGTIGGVLLIVVYIVVYVGVLGMTLA